MGEVIYGKLTVNDEKGNPVDVKHIPNIDLPGEINLEPIILKLFSEFQRSDEEMKFVLSAITRQIPRKPIVKCPRVPTRCCPSCKEYLIESIEKFYCGKCGQRLDWRIQ